MHGLPSEEGVFPAKEFLFPTRHLIREPVDVHWLPPNVRNIYREMHLALRNCLRTLTAIGTRATIEAVCNQQGASSRTLYGKVEDLRRANLLTKEQQEALHAHRLLGNDAAHDLAEPSDEELTAAIDVLDAILNAIYIMPKRKALMKHHAELRKREPNQNDLT
jgi:hypothetical protein